MTTLEHGATVGEVGDGLRPFSFDGPMAARSFAEQGWVHLSGGTSPAFFATLVEQVDELVGMRGTRLDGWRIPGKKLQFLWELPPGLTIEALCAAVAEVAGFDPATTVLAERHLKVYDDDAPVCPPAHKDRSASTLTVGIGISIPEASRLVLWPETGRGHNPYPTSAEWRDSRRGTDLPEVVLADVAPIEVDLRAGDVVMFRGAEIYHERYRPAGCSVLYLKFNDVGLDPLGEDPRTLTLEQRSAELATGGLPPEFTLRVSPRVVGITTEEYFPDGDRHIQVRFLDRATGPQLDEPEAALLRRVRGAGVLASTTLTAVEHQIAEFLVRCGAFLVS
jgi:hypothetical protein